jgi:hypothetical protein
MMRMTIFPLTLHVRLILLYKIKSKKQLFREAVLIVLVRFSRVSNFGPHVIDLVDKPLMFLKVALHVLLGFLFEVVQFFFSDILPDPPHLLHDIQGRNVRVLLHYFWSRLKIFKLGVQITALTNSM